MQNYTLNGEDSLLYGGEMLRIQSLVNNDEGVVKGLEIQVKTEITQNIDFKTAYNLISGETSDGTAFASRGTKLW